MTEAYNDALSEQLKKNVWDELAAEAANMSKLEYATLTADIVGIFDPTPASDAVGLILSAAQGDALGALLSLGSMVPYIGDAAAKPLKIATKAPKTARALESILRLSDEVAATGKGALEAAGLSLEQVAKARTKALERVQQAMLDAKRKLPGCQDCKLVGPFGQKRQLQMPRSGRQGKWKTADGAQPSDGDGIFEFSKPRTLPDGRAVDAIEFRKGAPDFDAYVEGPKYDLWEVTGNADTDGRRLVEQMQQKDPAWAPPSDKDFVLHHFEDGKVGYVPRVVHDKAKGGVGHTGGNSMINNELF